MPYDITDKTAPFALAYGINNLHAGNGKLIRHSSDIVGLELQVKVQLALLMGVQHAVRKVTYDGTEITSGDYIFHKGTPGEVAADAIFPTDVNHWVNPLDATSPAASFLNIELPVGIKFDNHPEKIVVQLETTETADYNSSGSQTGFGYDPNPARAAAHAIKTITGSTGIIEWGAWAEWKASNAELITITKDDEEIEVPRFRLDAFFLPPFTLKEVLNRICQLTCSDWQWRNGKIRFIPATKDTVDYNFDLTRVAWDFEFEALQAKNLYNGVRGSYRSLDDPLLAEAQPIIVDRRASPFEPENFYELNLGVAYQDQAERVTNYWTKIYCDLKDYASIRGSYKSYPVLPGDIATLTHPVPDWDGKRLKVIKKTEKEDRSTREGREKGEGYQFYLRVEPENPYSDTDFTPIVTREPSASPNRYAAPPAPTLEVEEQLINQHDGTAVITAFGTVTFGAFAHNQYAKIYWKKPGSLDYEQLIEVTPDADNIAEFRALRLASGTHLFKAVAINSDFPVTSPPSNIVEIIIDSSDFKAYDRDLVNAADKVNKGLNGQSQYVGNDTDVVPVSRITAAVIKSTVIDNGMNVEFIIAGEVLGAKDLQTAQGESINRSSVEVFNKFGEFVTTLLPKGFTGFGTLGEGTLPLKYNHPHEELIYKIFIRNRIGISEPKYLKGSTLSNSMPAVLSRSNTPLELTATPISDTVIRLAFQFSGESIVVRRNAGATAWEGVWGGLEEQTFDVIDLIPYQEYEFQIWSEADQNRRSNIARARTFPPPQSLPNRLSPMGLTGFRNPGDSTKATISWTRQAADNTHAHVFVNGVYFTSFTAAAGTSGKVLDAVPSGELTVKVKNYWGVDDESGFSNEITIPAYVAPADQPPSIDSVSYNTGNQEVTMAFTPHGGSGNYTIEWSPTGTDGTWTELINSLVTSPFTETVNQNGSIQIRKYRVKRNDVDGYSNPIGEVSIPAIDTEQSPIGLSAESPDGFMPVTLQWLNRTGSGMLKIDRRKGSGAWGQVLELAPNGNGLAQTTEDLAAIPSQGVYSYRIYNTIVPGVYSEAAGILLDI